MIDFNLAINNLVANNFDIQENVFSNQFISTINSLDLSLKSSTIGNLNNSLNKDIRSDSISWLSEDNLALQEYWNVVNDLKYFFNKELFMGINSFETHFAQYNIGNFYKKHLDSFKVNNTRKVTFITYVHEDWNNNDGGELVLYLDNKEIILNPTPKSTVLFLSEKIPHEVLPTKNIRKSITGWFKI